MFRKMAPFGTVISIQLATIVFGVAVTLFTCDAMSVYPRAEMQCGVEGITESRAPLRIVGGDDAAPHQFPWMAYVQVQYDATDGSGKSKFGHCGGALIDEQWIVTAAHCFAQHNDGFVLNPHGSRTIVILGAHNITDPSNEHLTVIQPKAIISHERYRNSTTSDNDIALIQLPQPLDLTQTIGRIAAICLPTEQDMIDKVSCKVVGWGRTSTTSSGSNVLKMVDVTMYDADECIQYGRHVDKLKVCAGFLDHRPCKGDSGGPLQCRNQANQWVKQGIVSYGPTGCVGGKPSVFTNVVKFVPWIDKIRSRIN